MSLFQQQEQNRLRAAQPLAARMRPASLSEFVGQRHFLAPGKLLNRLIKADRLGSVIFFGPPGTGKTTLARLLAGETQRHFCQLSAITHGVKDLRAVLAEASDRLAAEGDGTLLFIDEIHRFNRTQQDALLGDVESGVVTLVGATTSNPFFAVNQALVSRSQVFQFEPLSVEEIESILNRALTDVERGLGNEAVEVEPGALHYLAQVCDGDARRALGALEIAVRSSQQRPLKLNIDLARESVAQRQVAHDPTGDSHYDTISALIKSVRGSDPDAGLYWLARMLEAGEDIRFLCRRLVILASEDIGNADPAALPLAVSCFQGCEMIGLPESQLLLSQTVTYLACAPKSNAATVAIGAARRDIREGRLLPVPRSLRDSHYAGAAEFGHGENYVYSHDEDGAVASQDYLGVERVYYEPTDRGFEAELMERLQRIRSRLSEAKPPT